MQPCEPAHLIELPPEPSLILEGMLFGRSNFYISKGTCNYLLPWGRGKGEFPPTEYFEGGGALKKIDRQREGIIRILKSQRRDQVNFTVATKIYRFPPPHPLDE